MKLKKLAAMLFTLCLIIAMMPLAVFAETDDEAEATGERWGKDLYILGRQITSSGDVGTDVPHKGTITYEKSTKTLTLDNATLDLKEYEMPQGVNNNYVAGICAWDEINIVLIGSNRIESSQADNSFSGKSYVYGIKNSSGNINISGGGSLAIELANGASSSLFGIDGHRNLGVSNSTLTITVNKTGTGDTVGIDLFGDFGIKDGANVSVTANGGGSTAVDGTGMFDDSYVDGSSTILTMISDGTAFKCYLPSEALKSLAGAHSSVSRTASDAGASEWNGTDNLADFKYVRFTGSDAGAQRAGSRVYILGRKIDSDYEDITAAIPHDGKIGYDTASNTLTLNNATLDLKDFQTDASNCNMVAGIYSTSGLNIVLVGNNTIKDTSTDYRAGTEYVYGIDTWGKLNISGGGTLNMNLSYAATSEVSKINFYGIGSDDEVSVDGSVLNIEMGNKGKPNGMYLWAPLKLKNAATVTVSAKGDKSKGVNGTNAIGDSEVSGDSVLEMTSDNIAFNCWTKPASLREMGAMVNEDATPEGAVEWDQTNYLKDYSYVKLPYTEPDSVPAPDSTDPVNPAPVNDLSAAEIKLSKTRYTYNKRVQKLPAVKVALNGTTLKQGTDYAVSYSNKKPKKVGSYTVTVTGRGGYTGTNAAVFTIKYTNTLRAWGKTSKVNYAKLRNGDQTLPVSKMIRLKRKGQGAKKYSKLSGNKNIMIDEATGRVTVKAGLKKGTYKVKAKVTAAGDSKHNAASKTVTFRIRIR